MLHVQWSERPEALLSDPDRIDPLSGGVPFRQSAWLGRWWDRFGGKARLRLLTASDDAGDLVGVLPLYSGDAGGDPHQAAGRALRSLADGNACSDHVSILTGTHDAAEVARAMGEHLIRTAGDSDAPWDTLTIDGVSPGDVAIDTLCRTLQAGGGLVHRHWRMNTWFCDTSTSWDDFLLRFDRDGRGKQRRLLKRLQSDDQLSVSTPTTTAEVHAAVDELIRVHQQRWNACDVAGSFADPAFAEFIHAAAESFFVRDRLWLATLRRSGSVVSAAMLLLGDDQRAYCYATGTDLTDRKLEAGKMLTSWLLRQSCETGLAGIDFLRGDEDYKPRLKATATPSVQVRIAAPLWGPRLCHAAFLARFGLKQFVRRRLGRPAITVLP